MTDEQKEIIEYHDGLDEQIMAQMFVYRLTIIPFKGPKHIHYYDSSNGEILVELMKTMVSDGMFDIQKIEIEKL